MDKIDLIDRKISALFFKSEMEGYKIFFEKINDILVWLVGFSITGTGILMFNKFNYNSNSIFYYDRILFLITIITGISYRLLYSLLARFIKKLDLYFNYAEKNIKPVPSNEDSELLLKYMDYKDIKTIRKELKEKQIIGKDELGSIDFLSNEKIIWIERIILETIIRNHLFTYLYKMHLKNNSDLAELIFNERESTGLNVSD